MRSEGLIGRYLVELDAELRLPDRTRRRIVTEARDHLYDMAADSGEDDDVAAQAWAIDAFGAPKVVARRFAYELALGATRRATRRGAAMFVLALVLWDVSTSSFIHVAPRWINDGPGSALLWIIGQVGLIAGVTSLVRARIARRADGLDTARLRYVVRGLAVLAACTAITVAIVAAGAITQITMGAADRSSAALATLILGCLGVTASSAWQAGRRLATIDDTPLAATGREAPVDMLVTAADGLAWVTRQLPLTDSFRQSSFSWAAPRPVVRVLGRFDPREHPWRYGSLIALLAGSSVPVLGLVVLVLKGELHGSQLSQLTTAAPALIAIETMLVLAGYAILGRYLGLRPTRTSNSGPPGP